jgi:hypothetical protein
VIEAIGEFVLEPFYASYHVDGHGRAAHDPEMMLTLLVYAYCVGERSSRGIERRCREDVAQAGSRQGRTGDHDRQRPTETTRRAQQPTGRSDQAPAHGEGSTGRRVVANSGRVQRRCSGSTCASQKPMRDGRRW